MSVLAPASFAALATRVLPSTFTIHCLVRSREGWITQASNTTASAPRKCGTRSSSTTSAVAHSTLGTVIPGNRRASPRTDSTLSSFSSDRSTLVPMLPVAPTTTTLMLVLYPRGPGVKRGLVMADDAVPSMPVLYLEGGLHAGTGDGSARQGRPGDGSGADGGRPRRAGHGCLAAGLRTPGARRARLLPSRPHRCRRRVRGRPGRGGGGARRGHPRADQEPAARRLPEQPDGRLQRAGSRHQVRRLALRQHLERDRPGLLLRGAVLSAGLRPG